VVYAFECGGFLWRELNAIEADASSSDGVGAPMIGSDSGLVEHPSEGDLGRDYTMARGDLADAIDDLSDRISVGVERLAKFVRSRRDGLRSGHPRVGRAGRGQAGSGSTPMAF